MNRERPIPRLAGLICQTRVNQLRRRRIGHVLRVIVAQPIGQPYRAPLQLPRNRRRRQHRRQPQQIPRRLIQLTQARQQRGGDAALVAVGQGLAELRRGEFQRVAVGLAQVLQHLGIPAPRHQRRRHIDRQRVVTEFGADRPRRRVVRRRQRLAACQQPQRLVHLQLRQLDRRHMVDQPRPRRDERAAERVRREPRRQLGVRVARDRRQVIDDPQKRLPVPRKVPVQARADLRHRQAVRFHTEVRRDADDLAVPLRLAQGGLHLAVAVRVPERPQPEHPTRIRRPEAQRVFLRQQALAHPARAAHLQHPRPPRAADAGEHGGLLGLQGRVQPPHLAQPPDKPRRAQPRRAVPRRPTERPHAAQRRRVYAARRVIKPSLDPLGHLVRRKLRRAQVQLVEQLGQDDVRLRVRLGVDDQHAPARILPDCLRRAVGGGQLPLAGPRGVVVLRVPDQQRPNVRQTVVDGALDAGEGVDLAGVLPDGDAACRQRGHQRGNALGVETAVA